MGFFAGSTIPGPENKWVGGNRTGWSDAEYDALFDRVQSTLDPVARGQYIVQAGRVMTEQVPGASLYFVLMAILILFFTYFYTSIIFNPVDLAENLKKQGGFIPGVKPGAKTAEYIDDVVSKITLPGALFLAAVALLPIWISNMLGVQFNFGGTSLLIVVGVAMDTVQQVESQLIMRHYDGFMKKSHVRGRRA